VVVIGGEPGIGKTRLVEELTTMAERSGAAVLVGGCVEGSEAPALRPWGQIIEACVRHSDARAAAVKDGADPKALAEALPELQPRVVASKPTQHLEPDRARFRVFDNIARLLTSAARRRPIVVILEDMHAADAACLDLFKFVAVEADDAALLLVVTYRTVGASDGPTLDDFCASLSHLPRHRQLLLRPLQSSEAYELARMFASNRVIDAVLQGILARAEGSPLFIRELVRSVLDDPSSNGSDMEEPDRGVGDLPSGVRALIDVRLARLPSACLRVLTVGAVIGREFGLREVEATTGRSRKDVLRALDAAMKAQVVAECADGVAHYRFTHALIRERLYERLRTMERSELHRRIGGVLEALHGDEIERHLSEIAYHFTRGSVAGDAEKALEFGIRAGRAALGRSSHEQALRHFERALDVWRTFNGSDAERCEILLGIGEAHRCAGAPELGHERFMEAVELARALCARGDVRADALFARAALGVGQLWGQMGTFDAPLVRLLEEACASLEEHDPLHSRLLARMAVAYYWTDEVERRDELSMRALAAARRTGDPEALAFALFARHFAIYGPMRVAEQLAVADEAIRLGHAHGNTELELSGRFWRFLDLLGLGDNDGARDNLREHARGGEKLRHPFFRAAAMVPEAMFATLEGRFGDAERLAFESFELGRRSNSRNAEHGFGIHMLMLARLRGTEDIVLEPVRQFIEKLPAIPAWRAALASLHAALGHEREARAELDRISAPGLARVPRDINLLVCCALLAEVCAFLGERRLARELCDRMAPHAARSIIVANGAGHLGVVAHYLGIATATAGDVDEADRWYADALARYERMGSAPFVARVLVDRATTSNASTQTRVEMLTRARAIASDLGMARYVERADAVLAALQTSRTSTVSYETPAREGRIAKEGQYWTIALQDAVVHLRDAKGVHYLVELLRCPGRDLHVLDLAGVLAEPSRPGNRPTQRANLDGGGTGPLLDARAKAEYRSRIAELSVEIAGADEAGDIGRATALRAELDEIERRLAAALGLHGRDRAVGAHAERARLNVTRALRAVVRTIAASNPVLGRHLAASLTTGRFCRYEPAAADQVQWSL
jgi:tetratricopeptide (TPR) repeat protein